MYCHAVAVAAIVLLLSTSPAWASHGGKCVVEVELDCWNCSGEVLSAEVLSSEEEYGIGGGIVCPKVGSDVEIESDDLPDARRGDRVAFTYHVQGNRMGESREWRFQSVVARGTGCSSVHASPGRLLPLLFVAVLFMRRRTRPADE